MINTRAVSTTMIVTVVCFSRNVVELLPMMKATTAEVATNDFRFTTTILPLLQLGIGTVAAI